MVSYMYKDLADLGSHELLRAFFLVMIGRTKTNQAKSYHLSLNLPKYYKQASNQAAVVPT